MKKTYLLLFLIVFSKLLNAQNQNISNQLVFEGEPYLAINPSNSQNIVVAWMGYVFANAPRLSIKVRSTFNGGQSWSPIVVMPHIASTYTSADPSLAFDHNGNLFLSYIDHRETPDSGGVYVFKSTNGGLNWGAPVQAIDMYADNDKKPIDRPFLVINETGDKLYMTSKPPSWVAAPNRPYFVSSTDFGATWNPWRYVDTTNYLVGSLIAAPFAPPACVGNNFSCVYPSYVTSQNILPQYILANSTDNGNHFSYNTVYAAATTSAQNDSAKMSYRLVQNPINLNHKAFIFPFSQTSDIDIFFTETFNDGNSWSTPIRINDDALGNGKLQDLIWADFDNDGDLAISWRDRRNAPGIGYNKASEFYAAFRDKDSANFAANFKLSDSLVNFHTILVGNGNDFMGMELENDTISAVWGNTRDGSLDIWFSRIAARTGNINQVNLIESESKVLSVYPSPTTGIFNIKFEGNIDIQKIEIQSIDGKTIYSSKNPTKTIDLSKEKAGIYYLFVTNQGKIYRKSIQKI
ncbi:MAG: T9SS type A sorting domain-containing protein [Flavobacteriia bacterium]|jgi:hypothetical protein